MIARISTTIVLALILSVAPASSHQLTLPDGNTVDYENRKQPNGEGDCCGGRHCAPVESQWHVDGLWLDLGPPWGWVKAPEDRILLPIPEAPEYTHACWDHSDRPGPLRFYCIFPKATGA
jgi:hypothetical protein